MTETNAKPAVIRGDSVHRVEAPVLVDSGNPMQGHRDSMTVIPVMQNDRVEGFEVRCHCGSAVVVECIYDAAGGES